MERIFFTEVCCDILPDIDVPVIGGVLWRRDLPCLVEFLFFFSQVIAMLCVRQVNRLGLISAGEKP